MSAAAAVATTGGRDLARPVPFLRAARAVFDLSLETMVWSRRSLAMFLLLAGPVLFGLIYRGALVAHIPPRTTGLEIYGWLVAFYYIRNVLPLTALFYATSLIADEVEGRTLTYLLTRPVPRAALLVGKFAAYLVTTLSLALPPLVLSFFLFATARGWRGASRGAADLFIDLAVSALALLAYGAFFTLLGTLLRRPTIPGLLFLFGWELVANLPGYMPRLTLTGYLRSLIRHRPAAEDLSEMFGQVLPTALCLEVLAAAAVFCLGLSCWVFSRREYVMEQ